MKDAFQASSDTPRIVTTVSNALAGWYAAHSTVRRLWAIENSEGVRVIVALEPTHHGDDTLPVWLANCDAWAIDLQVHLQRPVLLEQTDDPSLQEIQIDAEDVIVADLCWRDPCMFAD